MRTEDISGGIYENTVDLNPAVRSEFILYLNQLGNLADNS
jgi:hypothetical protein